jgi:glucose/arabinose dehydrogenase
MQPPPSFEANQGQADRQVRFLARGQGYNLFLTAAAETVLTLAPPAIHAGERQRHAAVRVRLLGVEGNPVVEGLDETPTRSNYFIGRDPAGWRTNIPHYARVRLRDVYPGVDEVFHAEGGQFEYDFVVSPGAEPSHIRLAFDGVDAMHVNDASSLVLGIGAGEIEQRAPHVYQDIDGSRQAVAARYVVTGPREIGFEIAAYDRTRPLVIDPVLAYATYLGGSSSDSGDAVATDSAGSVYVTGVTGSTDFPTVNPVQSTLKNTTRSDAFVVKIDPTGTRVLYATYFGGSENDSGSGIAVDAGGNAYVTGLTRSSDLPTRNAVQSTYGGNGDGFVMKLNADGSALTYSTYLGGSNGDDSHAIAVDRDGGASITGETNSSNFPVVNALQAARRGGAGSSDAFISKLEPSGAALAYSTYLGGNASDAGRGIALDAGGNAYVAGDVIGALPGGDFPTLNARQPAYGGGTSDAFVAKVTPRGSLLYSTYLGGSESDSAKAIAVTSQGRAYITGSTGSSDFPAVSAYKATIGQATAYKSTDGGQSWRPLGLNGFGVTSIAVDRQSPSTVYAATANGLFKTIDGGAQWTAIDPSIFSIVAVDPFDSRTLYAARPGDNLFKSTDGGHSWAKIAVDTSPRHTIVSLAIDPARPQRLYAGSYSTIARTLDGGASWAYAGTDKASAIAVDPLNPSIVYAGRLGDGSDDGRGGMYKSTNSGETWVTMNRGPIPPGQKDRDPSVYALAVDPRTTSTIYVVTGAGVFKSTGAGEGWAAVNSGLPALNTYPSVSLVIDPLNPSVVYLGTLGNGVFKTSNGGATWAPINNGLLHLSVSALAVSPAEPGVVYLGTTGHTDDAFLASLSADGGSLLSSTFLGGGGNDVGTGVAVDSRGNAYVTGWTASNSFPAADAFQAAPGGGEDAFVAAFNGAGSALLYASYIGGSGNDRGSGIAVDQAGNVMVTGATYSTNFPISRPLLPPHASQYTPDAFVVKIAPVSSSADLGGSTARVTVSGAPNVSSASPASSVFTTRDGVRYQVETAAADLDSPWALAFAPDGRLFVTERVGRVRILDAALRSSSVALTVGDVFVQGDAGLLGLALDPDFAHTRLVYLYYTARAGAGAVNRVVRYRERDGRLTGPVVLLDDIPGNTIHNGGRLRFGPDDLLYIATGDAGVPSLAQDLASLAGKILRLNRDGTTPRGNPFASPLFSSGHRDPQGLDWHPVTGDLWSDDVGLVGNDEINIVSAGANYGWPRVAGHDSFPGMQPPAAVFESAIAPSGGSFYRAGRMDAFEHDFFMATLDGNGLLRIRVDPSSPRRIVGYEWLVGAGFGRLRSVIAGPDGLLYFVTSNGRTGPGEPGDRILRLVPR